MLNGNDNETNKAYEEEIQRLKGKFCGDNMKDIMKIKCKNKSSKLPN